MSPATSPPIPGVSAAARESLDAGARGRGASGGLLTIANLLEAVLDLSTAEQPDAVYRRIADGLRSFMPWDTFSVLLRDDEGRLYFRWLDGHPDPGVKSWVFGPGQGLVGRALAGQTQSSDGAAEGLLPGHGFEIAVPLVDRGDRVLGVLSLGRFEAGTAFSDREVELVEIMCRHLGRAIESSCAHTTTRRLAKNLSLLQETGRELTSILDRGELLKRIADRLEGLIDYQLFSVFLWSEDQQVLTDAFTHRTGGGSGSAPAPMELRLGEGLCGSAAALRQSIRVGNVRLDPRFLPCGDERVRSALAVPLLFEDRLLGVLNVESHQIDAFSPELEQMLLTLGSSVAVALANAELYEQLRRDERMMAKDLETARGVQRLLVPRSSPWIDGLQIGAANSASKHLGGDLYDFFPYGSGRVALALGDVAGKGTAAALYAALVLGALRGHVQQTQCSPSCVLSHLHDELRQLEVERRFLAFTFAVFDSDSRSLQLANAGLPYAMLLRRGEVRELEVGGLPLGTMALGSAPRDELELVLEPGDIVLFATDGVEESRDAEGRAFGADRVGETLVAHRHLSAQEMAAAVLHAADSFADKKAASDDRTALVLKVNGP
ncbi:MAG: SpoIIE family protein phosphatase [Acidobacteriota bacterium]